MNPSKSTTIFVAGTDTDVGKTYTACLLAKSLVSSGVNVAVYKPVASGCLQSGQDLVAQDAVELWESAGKPGSLDDVCPQKFLAPLAPTQAAIQEDRTVDANLLYSGAAKLTSWNTLIVEGAGGLMSPLAENVLNIDLCKQFADPRLIIVAANRLGAIHQTLATCASAAHHGVKPAGIILCGTNSPSSDSVANPAQSNAQEIAKYTDVPILAEIAYGQESVAIDWFNQLK